MPAKNILRTNVPNAYYHVYNKGIDGRVLFADEQDYTVFLDLLKRYLSPTQQKDAYGRTAQSLYADVQLLAFSLNVTNFHLLLHIGQDPRALTTFLRRICTAYTMYFNKKYKRVGNLFQGRFKATHIAHEPHVLQVSRYIHRTANDYYNWPFSSYGYYIKGWQADWVRPQKVYDMYDWGTYEAFVNNDPDFNQSVLQLVAVLADK